MPIKIYDGNETVIYEAPQMDFLTEDLKDLCLDDLITEEAIRNQTNKAANDELKY
jgi:hypothetical protein